MTMQASDLTRRLWPAAIVLLVACSSPPERLEPEAPAVETSAVTPESSQPTAREATPAAEPDDDVAPEVPPPSGDGSAPIYVLGPVEPEPSTELPTLESTRRPRAIPEREVNWDVSAVTLQPAGVVFDIPYQLNGEHFYSGARLSQVRECETREWQYEYARVANAALPFDALAVHIGSERFCDGVSFDGVQVRAYVLDSPVEQAVEVIRRNAGAEIANLPRAMPPSEPDGPPDRWTPSRTIAGWTTLLARYDRRYGDYGGRANMDFHLRRFGEHTVVILFMYVRTPVIYEGQGEGVRVDPMEVLVRSVHVPE